MIADKDEMFLTEETPSFALAVSYVVGDREEQQDCFGFELREQELFFSLCDGMGGHSGGRKASYLAVSTCLQEYHLQSSGSEVIPFLLDTCGKTDRLVHELTDPSGTPLNAGTTGVLVEIRDGLLYWASVGDSRAYLMREGAHVQVTKDQNYQTVLEEQLQAGVISREKYDEEQKYREALINYIGIGDLSLIDYCQTPIPVLENDRIIIMSDGLYKLVSDDEIFRILENFLDLSEALRAIEAKARRNARVKDISRDNMTVALIRVKKKGESR